MLKFTLLPAALLLAAFTLAGCGENLQPGYTEYTMPEENTSSREIKEDSVDALASQEHAAVSLDGSYLAQYGYSSANFANARSYVSSGEAAARASYNEAIARYSFWSAVIDDIDMDGLEADFEATAAALEAQISSIAAQQKLSLSEFAAQYDMSGENLDAFLGEMAEGLCLGETVQELCEGLEAEAQDAFISLRDAMGMTEYASTEGETAPYAAYWEDPADDDAEEADAGASEPGAEASGTGGGADGTPAGTDVMAAE